jgi:FKBP12-rapamycin complex-associated protein
VHDPLINWRLFNFNEVPQVTNYGNAHSHTVVNSEEAANRELMQPPRGARERELLQVCLLFLNLDCSASHYSINDVPKY